MMNRPSKYGLVQDWTHELSAMKRARRHYGEVARLAGVSEPRVRQILLGFLHGHEDERLKIKAAVDSLTTMMEVVS